MLDKNLAMISNYNKILSDKIKNHVIKGNLSFDMAQSGDYILYYDNIPLHSTEDPQKEAMEAFNLCKNKDRTSIIILYGLGLGYLLKRFYLSYPGRIIVYEPNPDILKVTMESVDFAAELSDSRILLTHTHEDLLNAIKQFHMFTDPVEIATLQSYKLIEGDLVQNTIQEIINFTRYLNNDSSTLCEMSKLWVDNGFNNLKSLFDCQYIDSLRNKFNGIPAILISPGPSLVKNIEQIKPYINKSVIITVGAALRIVKEEYDITPHFSSYADGQESLAVQLDGVTELEKINAIMQPIVHKAVFSRNFKRKFFYLADNACFTNWLGDQLGLNISHFSNMGSVALTSFYAAITFGCNPIILLGQDLSYSKEGKAYSDSKITDYFNDRVNIEVPGWYGDKVYTIPQYADFIKDFEILADKFKSNVRLINATEGGAYLKGFEHLPFCDVTKYIPDQILDIENIIENSVKNYINPMQKRRLSVLNALKAHKNGTKNISDLIKSAREVTIKLERELNKPAIVKPYVSSLMEKLVRINGKINGIMEKDSPLLLNYLQKEGIEFNRKYRRFQTSESIEDKKLYISLYNDLYKAMLDNIPRMVESIDSLIVTRV